MSWNRYYLTEAFQSFPQHVVTQFEQSPKAKGREFDTWLSCLDMSEDLGYDCCVKISGLHPLLDGIQQIDKADRSRHRVAIKAPAYTAAELSQIYQAIASQTPVVQKQHQVRRDLVLHELTVSAFAAADAAGNQLDEQQIQDTLQTTGAATAYSAGPYTPPMHWQLPTGSFTGTQPLPIGVLPSTVIGDSPAPQHTYSSSSAGGMEHVSLDCETYHAFAIASSYTMHAHKNLVNLAATFVMAVVHSCMLACLLLHKLHHKVCCFAVI